MPSGPKMRNIDDRNGLKVDENIFLALYTLLLKPYLMLKSYESGFCQIFEFWLSMTWLVYQTVHQIENSNLVGVVIFRGKQAGLYAHIKFRQCNGVTQNKYVCWWKSGCTYGESTRSNKIIFPSPRDTSNCVAGKYGGCVLFTEQREIVPLLHCGGGGLLVESQFFGSVTDVIPANQVNSGRFQFSMR